MHRFVYAAFIGFVLGIAWRSLYDFGWSFVIFLTVVCTFFILLRFARVLVHEWVLYALIALLFFIGGVIRLHLATPTGDFPHLTNTLTTFEGKILREPDVRDTYVNLIVASESFAYRVLVRSDSFQLFEYADTIRVTGTLEPVENFESENGRVFNYRGYLAKDDIQLIASFPTIEVLSKRSTPTGFLLRMKQTYLSALKKVLPEPSAALAGGVTVGERRSLGDQLSQDFRDTGLIHIVVLSGYNIAIIIIFISVLLAFLPPRPRYTGAIISIVLFTVIVGASATVVRAAIMGSIGALGAMVGRTYDALHGLVVAGLIMLLWNPYLLLFDPSFQLSFVATLGLLLGIPLLTPHMSFIPERFALRELTAATVATQIAVAPLLMYMMGEISLVALPVNLLVLPFIPLAMLAAFLTGVVGSISVVLALPLGIATHGLLSYVFLVVETFAGFSFSKLLVPEFPFVFIIAAYTFLGLSLWFKGGKKRTRQTSS